MGFSNQKWKLTKQFPLKFSFLLQCEWMNINCFNHLQVQFFISVAAEEIMKWKEIQWIAPYYIATHIRNIHIAYIYFIATVFVLEFQFDECHSIFANMHFLLHILFFRETSFVLLAFSLRFIERLQFIFHECAAAYKRDFYVKVLIFVGVVCENEYLDYYLFFLLLCFRISLLLIIIIILQMHLPTNNMDLW